MAKFSHDEQKVTSASRLVGAPSSAWFVVVKLLSKDSYTVDVLKLYLKSMLFNWVGLNSQLKAEGGSTVPVKSTPSQSMFFLYCIIFFIAIENIHYTENI